MDGGCGARKTKGHVEIRVRKRRGTTRKGHEEDGARRGRGTKRTGHVEQGAKVCLKLIA